jgi:hypothetical protein
LLQFIVCLYYSCKKRLHFLKSNQMILKYLVGCLCMCVLVFILSMSPSSPPRGIICMGKTCDHQWCVNIPRHPWTMSYHFFDTKCHHHTWSVKIPFKQINISGKNGECVTVDLDTQNFSSPFTYCQGITCVRIEKFISVRGFCH